MRGLSRRAESVSREPFLGAGVPPSLCPSRPSVLSGAGARRNGWALAGAPGPGPSRLQGPIRGETFLVFSLVKETVKPELPSPAKEIRRQAFPRTLLTPGPKRLPPLGPPAVESHH